MTTSELLKILSDNSKLRIVALLAKSPCFVHDIQCILQLQQSNTSRHLQKLLEAKLVGKKVCGKSICYFLDLKAYENYPLLDSILAAFFSEKQYYEDYQAYKNYLFYHPQMLEKLDKYKLLKEGMLYA